MMCDVDRRGGHASDDLMSKPPRSFSGERFQNLELEGGAHSIIPGSVSQLLYFILTSYRSYLKHN